MGEFAGRVRNDEIPGPLRRTFTTERWHRAFANARNPDRTDHDTYAAGLTIHKKLEAVREDLKLSFSDKVSATTKLRAFLAIANHEFFVTRERTRAAIEEFQANRQRTSDDVYVLEEMACVKIPLSGGAEWSPDEVIESIVDGVELPIKAVLQRNPSLGGNPRMNKIDWTEVAHELNLGILYRFAEDLWNDCLWNSYKIVDKGNIKLFLPQELDSIRAHRIGAARQTSLSMGFTMIAAHAQRDALANGGRMRVREVYDIERRGKKQFIKVAKHSVPTKVVEELSVMRTHASIPYYEDLLEERLDCLQGLTLSMLIDAWTVISRAAYVLVHSIAQQRARRTGETRAQASMPEYAPTLKNDALVEALTTATGMSRQEGRQAVEFFTFRGNDGQDIWAQPLIPVGRDTLTPIFAAVISPNLKRLVDVWMRQAKVELARRGPAFENHLRRHAVSAISGSRVLAPVAACISDNYTFRPTGESNEEIDLVFSIGNTVFIAEAKCILEPTDTKSIAMHRMTVLGAAKQALRKAKAVDGNRSAFIEDVQRFGMNLTEQFKVEPLVIVSTSTHVGVPALGVSVIDEFILARYLDGELEDISYQPGELTLLDRLKVRFYSNATEAEDRAPGYFASPPQMRRFVTGLRERVVPIYPANDRDWGGYFMTMECVAGGVPLALQRPD